MSHFQVAMVMALTGQSLPKQKPRSKDDTPYKMGKRAYREYRTTDANPFDQDLETAQHQEWLAGFQLLAERDWEEEQ